MGVEFLWPGLGGSGGPRVVSQGPPGPSRRPLGPTTNQSNKIINLKALIKRSRLPRGGRKPTQGFAWQLFRDCFGAGPGGRNCFGNVSRLLPAQPNTMLNHFLSNVGPPGSAPKPSRNKLICSSVSGLLQAAVLYKRSAWSF